MKGIIMISFLIFLLDNSPYDIFSKLQAWLEVIVLIQDYSFYFTAT